MTCLRWLFGGVVCSATVIDFPGPVDTVERAFHTHINNYAALDGRVFYANSNAPLVPGELRPFIQHISGLSNALQRQHPPLSTQQLSGSRATHAARLANAINCPRGS